MYLFKFLAHSFVLTPMVMLRMFPVLIITFFLVGVVIYVLSPYPIALGLVMVLITWPITILMGISFVRAALTQMRATTGADLGKLFRKTIQLSVFYFVITAFFSTLTWVVTASLVPENWREATIDNMGVSSISRPQVSFPTIDNRRSNRETSRPGVFSNRGLDDVNPGGVERFVRPERPEGAQERDTAQTDDTDSAEDATPEVQEEITSVTLEGEAAAVPSLTNFFSYVFDFYRPLMIGYFGVQFLFWAVLAALAVPFASQAANIASSGPNHEFLWGTGKKAVPIFLLMLLTNAVQLIGFIALTYIFGTSLTLAAQELETSGTGLQDFLRSGGYYIGALMLLSFFSYSWLSSGAAVAYVDSRADMQRKKDIELGRILASAEKGPDIRALIRARKEQGAMAEIPAAESDSEPGPGAGEDAPPVSHTIRPAEAGEVSDDGFSPMVGASDEDVGEADPASEPLKLSFDDEEPPEDYDEDWFLKPLPGEEGYVAPTADEAPEDRDPTEVLAARIKAAHAGTAEDEAPEESDPTAALAARIEAAHAASAETDDGPEPDPLAPEPASVPETETAEASVKEEDDEEEDEDLEWVRKLFREGDTTDERKG